MRKLGLAAVFCLLSAGAFAQQYGSPVTTEPGALGSAQAGGTIAVTNTFQSIFGQAPANNNGRRRLGCLVQNTGSNDMWVYVGAIAGATKNLAYRLVPPGTGVQGGSFSCGSGAGGALQDQISITGTSGDTFAATGQ